MENLFHFFGYAVQVKIAEKISCICDVLLDKVDFSHIIFILKIEMFLAMAYYWYGQSCNICR